MGGGGCMPKNMASKGGRENIGCKGGRGSQKNSFKFCSDDICDNRELNNGIEEVTQKVNSHCFKIHHPYCKSFNSLSNVGVEF